MNEDVLAPLLAIPFMLIPAGFSCFFGIFWLLGILLSIGGAILWVIMLIDVVQRPDDEFPENSNNEKTIWLLLMLLSGGIGAFIYYFLVYRKGR